MKPQDQFRLTQSDTKIDEVYFNKFYSFLNVVKTLAGLIPVINRIENRKTDGIFDKLLLKLHPEKKP